MLLCLLQTFSVQMLLNIVWGQGVGIVASVLQYWLCVCFTIASVLFNKWNELMTLFCILPVEQCVCRYVLLAMKYITWIWWQHPFWPHVGHTFGSVDNCPRHPKLEQTIICMASVLFSVLHIPTPQAQTKPLHSAYFLQQSLVLLCLQVAYPAMTMRARTIEPGQYCIHVFGKDLAHTI